MRLVVPLAVLSVMGCGRIGFDALGDQADAAGVVSPALDGSAVDALTVDGAPPGPDADLGIPLSLTQNADTDSIIAQWTFGCHESAQNPWITGENGYIRQFDLAGAGITSPYSIHSVRIGITLAIAGDGSKVQDAALKVYKVNGALIAANMTEVASVALAVPDQTEQFTTIPIEATVPGNSVFAVEYYVPDGRNANNTFTLGFYNLGETAPTYVRMPGCGEAEPKDIDEIDVFYEDFHLLMTVNGTY